MELPTQELIESLLSEGVLWGLRVIGAVALLLVGRWIAGALRSSARRALERAETDPTLVPFLSGIAYYLAIAVVLIAVLGLFGIETTSLVAVPAAPSTRSPHTETSSTSVCASSWAVPFSSESSFMSM